MTSIDLNCDLGEDVPGGEDIMPWITSANIACGAHAGTPRGIMETILLAMAHGVAIGAHPGFEDRRHFGRIALELPAGGYRRLVESQLETLATLVAKAGGSALRHLKLHGALYHMAAGDRTVAEETCNALLAFDPNLALVGPAGSVLEQVAGAHGIAYLPEGFCDRLLMDDGSLAPRSRPGAVITDPDAAGLQAVRLATQPHPPKTLCLHGDNPSAPAVAREVRRALAAKGITVRPPDVERANRFDKPDRSA